MLMCNGPVRKGRPVVRVRPGFARAPGALLPRYPRLPASAETTAMTIALGLFDIAQIDPTDADDSYAVYRRRLDDLALADEVGLAYAFTAERHFMATYRCPAPVAW